MAMDFFSAQDAARKRTRTMVLLFGAAVLCIALAIYAVIVLAMGYGSAENRGPSFFQPRLFFGTLGGVALLVGACSAFKISQLRAGGAHVARSLGGRRIDPGTRDSVERKLLNVVEEMAIASGVPVPEVYILPEQGINAFAAGFSPSDAVVAVTRGCIEALDRDELQGVVAHEFSHILNGDMRLNIRLMGVLFGILAIAVIGRVVLRSVGRSGTRRSGKGSAGVAGIALIALAVMLIGYIGVFFGRLIQSAISRQREYLADAAAVQFTRDPSGIAGALKKIGGKAHAGTVANAHAQEAAHFFFANAIRSRFANPFATHPPLQKRILAIEPDWDGRFIRTPRSFVKSPPKARPERGGAMPGSAAARRADFIRGLGAVSAAALPQAASIRDSLADTIEAMRSDPRAPRAILAALQIAAESGGRSGARQSQVGAALGPDFERATGDWLAKVRPLDLNHRFALAEIALPLAAEGDLAEFESLLDCLEGLAHADNVIDLEELALVQAAKTHLKHRRHPARRCRALPPAQLGRPILTLLAALSHTAGPTAERQAAAFEAGAKLCNRYLLRSARPLPAGQPEVAALTEALDTLADLPLTQKRVIFEAALAAVTADGAVERDEACLVRVVAVALGLPTPPLCDVRCE